MFNLLLIVIYLAFIGLGLPDSLLGAAWPAMYRDLGAPLSFAGVISMIIAGGTIVSSLQSDRLTRALGTGKVTALSVGLTALALFGFSTSTSPWMICLWAIPYGLGAGSVDASINNYVALHYKSHHMSWLHCMWGLGAAAGPYAMGYVLGAGQNWNSGYLYVAIAQIVLTVLLFASLPLWKERPVLTTETGSIATHDRPLSLKEIFAVPGVKELSLCFFCYCAVEATAILWASSYLSLGKGLTAGAAATFASTFFIGITVGRGISGFVTMKLSDRQMIRLGQVLIGAGVLVLFLPLGPTAAIVGLALVGLGCAPIYPCIIHAIPQLFGADKSQAIIGAQMASAYTGTLAMPALFGVLANNISVGLFPAFLLTVLVLMVLMHEKVVKKAAAAG